MLPCLKSNFKHWGAILLGVLFFPMSVLAADFSSDSFKVRDPIFSAASSTEMSSTNFRLTGAVGQIAIGTSSATNFRVLGGFLYFINRPIVGIQAGDGYAILYWTKDSGSGGFSVGSYSIGRSTISGGPYTYTNLGSTVTSSATSSATTNLTNGTTYYFVIVVKDASDNSIATSSEVSVTPSSSIYNVMTADFSSTVASSTLFVASGDIKVDITIPADILSSGEILHPVFQALTESSVTTDKPLPSGKLAANTFYDLSWYKGADLNQVTSFDKSVTLKFTYTEGDISGIDEGTMAPYRWNGSSWAILSGYTLDTSANTITVDTSSFSSFGLMGTGPVQSSSSASVSSGGGGGNFADSIFKILGLLPKGREFLVPPRTGYFVSDLNRDGHTDLADLSMFFYSQTKQAVTADFDKDGVVDLKDFSVLLYEWSSKGVYTAEEEALSGRAARERAVFKEPLPAAGTAFVAGELQEIKPSVVSAVYDFIRGIVRSIINFFVILWYILTS